MKRGHCRLLIFVGLFLPGMVDCLCYHSFAVLASSCSFVVVLVTSHDDDDGMMLLMWMIPCCCPDLFLLLVALTMMVLMGERQMPWLWCHSCIAAAVGRSKMPS